MPPYTNIPLSPAELSYLHTSLSQQPPLRPDGRSPTQFRALVAETDILPSANGSARICFADGTEAVVGVKAEVEKSSLSFAVTGGAGTESALVSAAENGAVDVDMAVDAEEEKTGVGKGLEAWVQVGVEIPGMRDDDALPVFLSAMLTEALLADGKLKDRLWINRRFHWRLYVDILLLSQPLSYPLPLLSLTTHLALLSTRLPALLSEKDEDPLFNDDWQASTPLYPSSTSTTLPKPPITLLVMSVGNNIIFDPSREELAVADSVLAISCATDASNTASDAPLKMIALRTIDPPSRLTGAGTPDSLNTTAGSVTLSTTEAMALREKDQGQTVWRPPRGGVKRTIVQEMIKMVLQKDGVGREVLDALAAVET